MRLDKYLKVSRLIKRRTVANEACDNGLVTVNGKPARASYEVKEGDQITLRFGVRTVTVEVLSVQETVRQISYAIGLAEPLSLYINTNKTNKTDESKILAFIRNNIDLTPQGIINYLRLRQPIYLPTAAYGHFGRQPGSDGTFSWEKLDLTEQLKSCF